MGFEFCYCGACFPPRLCELLIGHPLRDVRVDYFSYRPVPVVDDAYPYPIRAEDFEFCYGI